MTDFFDEFKPIRNILRKLNFQDVLNDLYAIRTNKQSAIVPEVVEFIYLNSIVYSPNYKNIKIKDSQKEWGKLLKMSVDLNNKINAIWIEQNLWGYLHKMMLNQLKSGSDDYHRHLYRYYYIFSKDAIAEHIESMIGMPYKDFFVCAMWLHSVFIKKFFRFDKLYFLKDIWKDTTFSIENMTKTLNILAVPFVELNQSLKNELRYDLNTFITHDYYHIKKPIFELDGILYCLFHEQLLNQFTSGIYYIAEIIKNENDLSNQFGNAFEDYVGLIIEKSNNSNSFTITKELVFKTNGNVHKTSDWIIEKENDIIFIECKTKRLQIESKKKEDILKSDIDEIAKAVVQVYKVYFQYTKDKIPIMEYDSSKNLIPIILTLEEWFASVPTITEEITRIVKSKLKEKNLDESLVDRFKFNIMSISSFEKDIQIMTKVGFKQYFETLANGKLKYEDFNFSNYFQDEIDQLFIKPLEKQFSRFS